MTDQRGKYAPRAPHAGASVNGSPSHLGETRPRARTGLLVSVRSAAEASVALHAGVDLLDVKEPSRGPLGRADCHVMAEVTRCAGGRVPVSAALGELHEQGNPLAVSEGIAFAKLGLAGCGRWTDWPRRWAAALAQLPRQVIPVAVAYADWQACDAPAPEDVLVQGVRLGCGAALLDTCAKLDGGLFDYGRDAEVGAWIAQARRLGMLAVVAGSLTAETARRAAALGPDYIAVRGAVCRGGRGGDLDADLIADLRGQFAPCQ